MTLLQVLMFWDSMLPPLLLVYGSLPEFRNTS